MKGDRIEREKPRLEEGHFIHCKRREQGKEGSDIHFPVLVEWKKERNPMGSSSPLLDAHIQPAPVVRRVCGERCTGFYGPGLEFTYITSVHVP